jgi:3-oxoacyl-ACP reductase-like protein
MPKKSQVDKKKKTTKPRRPRTLDVVKAAIIAQQKPRKGCSANAIRNYVKRTYSLAPPSMNTMVRRAILAGLKSGEIRRSKGSKGSGAVGYFHASKSHESRPGRKKSTALARKKSHTKKKKSKLAPKKKCTRKTRKTARPNNIDLVVNAIHNCKYSKGCTALAIRKYIMKTYNVPDASLETMVDRAILSGLKNGVIVQDKGGRFRAGKPKLFRKPATKKKTSKRKSSSK